MPAESLTSEVTSFFESYAEAFDAISGARIATFYYIPCVTLRADGSIHCFQSQSECAKFFDGVADTYYKEGLRRSEFKNLEVSRVGGRCLLATMDWVFYRGDGSLLKQWRQSYNLVRVDGRWHILASTFHIT